MLMGRLAILLSLIVLLGGDLAYAQSGNAWPPQPEDLLAPGIEVVRVEPVADNEARILYLYEAGTWHAYPYPTDFNRIGVSDSYYGDVIGPRVYMRPDGTWLVFEQDVDRWYRYNTWRLDPDNGTFTRIDPPCGVDQNLSDDDRSVIYDVLDITPISRAWVFTLDGEGIRLCSIVTEQRSDPLPDGVIYVDRRWNSTPVLPDVTPEGDRAVFMTYDDSQRFPHRQYHFYSYNLYTNEVLTLGTVEPDPLDDSIYIGGWLDHTHFAIIVTAMPEWSIRGVYVGDASQPDSVDFAASMLRFWPRVLSDPPSVEALDAEMEDGTSAGPCFLEHYEARTREHVLYDTGDLCDYGLQIPDGSGDRLYRAIFPPMTATRYNLATGARTNLYTGEIEWVGWVSPGGQYAVMGIGNNGLIDIAQDPNPNFQRCAAYDLIECLNTYVHSYLILDLSTGELVAEFPPSGRWFTDTTLLVTPAGDPHQLISLGRGGMQTQTLPGTVLLPLPERGQILLQNADGGVDLYSTITGQVIPIMHAVDNVDIAEGARDDGTLLVTIRRFAESNNARVRWTIHLP
jgi:hypothetical protein